MSLFGLLLLPLVALGLVATGLPAFLVLIGVSVFGMLVGLLVFGLDVGILTALPGRLVNLLENDLLQALPLYVLMGALLDRLRIADALYRSGTALLRGQPAAPLVSSIAIGAITGPMNGSVGASVLGLARVISPRLLASGVPGGLRHALVVVASTLGVVIPPSLVLILLGDAMLNAHTIALNATGRAERIINTQDVFRGALLPAGLFLAGCLLVAWWSGRRLKPDVAAAPLTRAEIVTAVITLLFLVTLLGGVATGAFYAVEAAALGATVLFFYGLLSGQLPGSVLGALLADVLATAGALFALLVAATTFTLLLRVLGADKLVTDWLVAMPGGDRAVAVVGLLAIGLSALVLDAFEIIFVVVPIVAPPLLMRVQDVTWVAVLVLLALQASFLLPPFGYALMMTRGALRDGTAFKETLRALAPFLALQIAVLLAVLAFPALVHLGEKADSRSLGNSQPLNQQEIDQKFRQMIPLPGMGQDDMPPPPKF